MSKYTPTFTSTTEFEGDTVTLVSRRLKRKHMLAIAGSSTINEQGVPVLQLKPGAMIDVMDDAVRESVIELSGLTDEGGSQVNLEAVLTEAYFMGLALWIVSELMEKSSVGEAAKKVSPPPQGGG